MAMREVKIGKLVVRVNNVPDDVSDDELYSFALMKLWEMNKEKAVLEMKGFKKAS